MFLSAPGETAYDLRFNVLGFPVRVHPAFFLMPVLMSRSFLGRDEMNVGVVLLVIVAVFFVSLLVHELGHCLAFRYFGIDSEIVLYLMGGLAIPRSFGGWRPRGSGAVTPWSQIIISAAGPVAGFLLAGLFLLVGVLLGGKIEAAFGWHLPAIFLYPGPDPVVSAPAAWLFLNVGAWINIFWNLINLAPVHPLDGGQIARQIFILNDPWNGVRTATITSVVVGGLIAVWGFSTGDQFMGLMFAMLAISNYQSISMGGGFGGQRPW